MARTSPACSTSSSVSGPSPGPISRTRSALLQLRGGHDAPQLVGVMQEVLAERLRQVDVALGQNLLHFREFHAFHRCNSSNLATL